MVPGNASWRLWLPLGTNVCVGVSPGKAHCIGRRRAFQAQKRGRGGWLSLDMAEVWTWWLGGGGWGMAGRVRKASLKGCPKGGGLVPEGRAV